MENRSWSESNVRRGTILRFSIGTKLAIAFLALAIIPMSAIAYYNLTRNRDKIAKLTKENLVGLSRSTAYTIEQLLTENQRTSATLAGEPLVAQFLAASDKERQALTPQVYQTLQNFADTHPDYDALGLLDVNGIVVASLADILVGKDRSFRDYFKASIQGKPYISDILVGRATRRPGVFLTNPVILADRQIVGIDIVWLKADTIWSIIDDVKVGKEGIAYLIDQDSVIIAHPNRDLLYHSLGELSPEAVSTISSTIRFGTVKGTKIPFIPKTISMDQVAAQLSSSQGSGTYRYYSPLDHRYHVVGYSTLKTHRWTVVVDLPEAQLLAPLKRMRSVAWISVGLVGVITLIISILLVRGITRPILRLTDAAVAVEQDQPFEPSDIEDVTTGHDEIAHLGRVFSGMVLTLRKELTERKKAEEKIKHLNLVLRAIRNVNQLIAREKDRDRFLKAACDNLIQTRGYYNAWIALLDENRDLVTTAEAGLGNDFLPMVDLLKVGKLTDCGQKALRQAEVVVTKDPLSSCTDCPLLMQYSGKGAMTIRLKYGGKIYGLLSTSIPIDILSDKEEQSLFQEVATDVAFALHTIELEEERKQAEKKLKEYSAKLEEIVEERTKEIKDAQEQLIRKEKLALLGQLAGSVSHELRNPLGVISNAIYYLKTVLPDADETTKEYLEIISSEVNNSDKIVSDLLDLSRTQPAERKKIVVSELVDQALEKQPPHEKVKVTTRIPSDLPPAFVDPQQIGQVLFNLITNAFQAMSEGGKLTISAELLEGGTVRNPKSEIRIWISDTGCGISKENMKKLFEPLFTTRAKGIGLGLSVSKNLVRVNGGSIEVESPSTEFIPREAEGLGTGKEGKGSTFTVILPTKEVHS